MDIKEMIERFQALALKRIEVLKQLEYDGLEEQFKELGSINKEIIYLNEEIEKLVETKYKVYFIESPSKKDIEDGRREYMAISSYFDLTHIPYRTFVISDKNDLCEAFNEIATDVLKIKKHKDIKEIFTPIIHFSAHGNETHFGMTNDCITWEELGEKLYNLNLKSEIDLAKYISDYVICMSVCNGASLRKILVEGNGTPFLAMVGSDGSISWGDSITAFQVFYYHLICKGKKLNDAIKAMRESSIFNGFECITDKRVKLI